MKKMFKIMVGLAIMALTIATFSAVMYAETIEVDFSEAEVLQGDWELTDEGFVSNTTEGVAVAAIPLTLYPQEYVYTFEWTMHFLRQGPVMSEPEDEDEDPVELGYSAGFTFFGQEKGWPDRGDSYFFRTYGVELRNSSSLIWKGNNGNFWHAAWDFAGYAARGGVYNMKLIVDQRRDGNMTLYVNGQEAIEWYEPSPNTTPANYISLRSVNASVAFTNFTITTSTGRAR